MTVEPDDGFNFHEKIFTIASCTNVGIEINLGLQLSFNGKIGKQGT